MVRRGRRSGRARRGVNRRTESKREAKIHHSGIQLKPSADPSSVIANPWNQVVVTLTTNLTTPLWTFTYLLSTIHAQLLTQLALTGITSGIMYRFRMVKVWEISGESFVMTPFNLASPNSWYTATCEDVPGRNRWAKTGFIWPASDQNIVFESGTDAARQIFRLTGNNTATLITHTHVMWKTAFIPPPNSRVRSAEYSQSLNLSSKLDVVADGITNLCQMFARSTVAAPSDYPISTISSPPLSIDTVLDDDGNRINWTSDEPPWTEP